MANCLAPGFVRLRYSISATRHVMTFCVLPAGPGEVDVRSGSPALLSTKMTELIDLLKPMWLAECSFDGYDFYTQADCSSAPTWVNSVALTGVVGTHAGGSVLRAWTEQDYTFRTTNGGRFKLRLMEAALGRLSSADVKSALSAATAEHADLRDFLIGTDDFIVGYDNGFPSLPLNLVVKTNDALRKRQLQL